jgi:nickel transport protein
VDHRVVAETGDGHRAEWRVSAAELAPGFPGVPSQTPEGGAGPGGAPSNGCLAEVDLAAQIEQAVARQVRPLREDLLAAQGTAGLRDVLGGIGYILGLAGLLAWWQSRPSRGPR